MLSGSLRSRGGKGSLMFSGPHSTPTAEGGRCHECLVIHIVRSQARPGGKGSRMLSGSHSKPAGGIDRVRNKIIKFLKI